MKKLKRFVTVKFKWGWCVQDIRTGNLVDGIYTDKQMAQEVTHAANHGMYGDEEPDVFHVAYMDRDTGGTFEIPCDARTLALMFSGVLAVTNEGLILTREAQAAA